MDQGLTILNLTLLLFIGVIPFAAQILAGSLDGASVGDQRLATALYSATMLGQALAFNAILGWARRQKVFYSSVGDALSYAVACRFLAGPSIYAAALFLTQFSPRLSMSCYLGVVGLYLWPGAVDLPTGKQIRESIGGSEGKVP